MASPVIELRNICLNFGDDQILRDINLQVHKGEIFVLIGPSGHGKSVLLKLMAGLIEPTSGELLIEGENFFKLSAQKQNALRFKMGMLFQKNALFDSLTSGENVAFPMIESSTTEIAESEIQKRVESDLQAVGLAHAILLYPDEISGGMQKRLGIARALALQPDIIYYDDPTAGLDPITSRKIVDLIIRLNKERHSTAVAVTNDMNRAYQMATHIGMIVNKELIVTGTPAQTLAHNDPRVHQFIRGQLEGPI